MASKFVCLCLLVLCMAVLVDCLPARKKDKKTKGEKSGCIPFKYCRGTSFPYRVRVKDWTVTCKQDDVSEADIRNKCCLPQEKHLVCYGIRVEGSKLNFSNDTSSYLTTTDFSDLCKHMVEAEGRKPGLYNSATFLPGGGELAFRYGVWSEVADGAERHIDNIACGVQD